MVSGDVSCGNLHLSVHRELVNKDVVLSLAVDNDRKAKASLIFGKAGLEFERIGDGRELKRLVDNCDLVFVGSADTAFHAEVAAIKYGNELGKITVIGSDSWLNHRFKQWIDVTPSFLLAIDDHHQNDILRLRSQWGKDRVPALGQPAFDDLFEIAKHKVEIREKVRKKLNIQENCKAVLYWSFGNQIEMCNAGFESVAYGIKSFTSKNKNATLIVSIHPKLSSVLGKEYHDEKYQMMSSICMNHNVRLIWVNGSENKIRSSHLNLAADLVLNHLSTGGIESAILGVPTVNILLPVHQDHYKKLGQEYPFQPILKHGAALGAFSREEIPSKMLGAVDPKIQKQLQEAGLTFASNGASKRIAEFLMRQLQYKGKHKVM